MRNSQGEQPGWNGHGWLYAGPALLWLALAFLVPLGIMAVASLWSVGPAGLDRTPSLGNYQQFFSQPSYWRAMTNSLEVAVIVTALSVVLAYPFAWTLAMLVPERWQRLALALAVVPFWTSYIVRSYAWLLVLSENGVLNATFTGLGLVSAPLPLANTRVATVVGFVHFGVMLLTLTIYASLKLAGTAQARAAADLGASPFQVFRHVWLPLTAPGIAAGAFLTFALTMGDVVTPHVLGGNQELLLPQLIMLQMSRRGDIPMAAALSLLLMLAITLAWFAAARWLTPEAR